MSEIIKTRRDLCTGCNRCVRECPMETANITYQDEAGYIKVRVDHDKCITCGRCLASCKHDARVFEDDTLRFFDDLKNGIPISLIAAPSIRTNIPDWKNLFTYLKQLGVCKIYDVSLGADICIWAYVRHIQQDEPEALITQPCPVIVTYCEMYRQDLIKNLSSVHSPMACTAIYMKEYEGITDRIAALSPCIAKTDEFEATGLSQYNITFTRLREYVKENKIELPKKQTGFDHDESGLGVLFPMPGGLKENIEYFLGKKLSIDKAEGYSVFDMLNTYADSPEGLLPQLFDVLNCQDGCNIGTACAHASNVFKINRVMDGGRKACTSSQNLEKFSELHKKYDDTFSLRRFLRKYKPVTKAIPQITDDDMENAFSLLGKNDDTKRSIDCGACGSDTCNGMARKIALGVNIPISCIVKAMEDARNEHIANLAAREQFEMIEAMREADERMRVILEANPHINVLFDSKYRVVDCNLAAMEFMGFETIEETLAGFLKRLTGSMPLFQSNGQPSVSIGEKLAAASKEGYTEFDTEIILNGVTCSLSVKFRKIPYEGGFGVAAYIIDMTAVHQREVDLIRARELNELQLKRLNIVVRASKIGLFDMEVVQGDPINPGNVFTFSDELRHMIGFDDEADLPNVMDSWMGRLHPDDKDAILNMLADYLLDTKAEAAIDGEYRLQKKNGDYAYVHAYGVAIRDENGNAVRFLGALNDITKTKNILFDTEKQKVEAEAANQAKSAFLSTMSHEIRTPLNAILGITEIQMQNDTLDQSVRSALEKIYSSGDLLLGIINDILDLSKIEAGKLELVISEYEIASLISDTAQLNMMRIGSKSIEFELHVDENLPALMLGDELRVKQILNNLLSNAFKYTDVGKVTLSVSSDKGKKDDEITLIVGVSDTGQGMTMEQIDKLFDEYSRFNMEANRTTEGTGLGMSILRNLIQIMGGEIFIESQPGKGSTFTVHLPQGKSTPVTIGKEMSENLHKFRTSSRAQMKRVQITREPMPYGSVLIVDDVETNIFVAKGLMVPYGLRIESTDSGFGAIEKIKNGKIYDIIFMDHMMPKMDGIEATKIIHGMGYSHPIVALTADAVAGQADIFLKSGFDDFISKPIDIRQLNTVLNRLIRDKQPPEIIEEARRQAETKKQKSADMKKELTVDAEFAKIFIRDANKSSGVLETIIKSNRYSEEELRTYVIHIHGMKSALANIGNASLSAIALNLEKMGRGSNIEAITTQTPAFLTSLRAFVEEIMPKEDGLDIVTEDSDTEYLREKLLAIAAACEEYDGNTAESLIAGLKKMQWSQTTREMLGNISEYLLHSDFDDIIDMVNKFLC